MDKRLLTVAVAALISAPVGSYAQSTVTISGFFKVSVENISIHSYGGTAGTGTPAPAGGRLAGTNSSEGRLADDFSRIVFKEKTRVSQPSSFPKRSRIFSDLPARIGFIPRATASLAISSPVYPFAP